MMDRQLAVLTGADGGMGTEILRALAKAEYRVIMICRTEDHAEKVRQLIMNETGNTDLEILLADLSSMSSVAKAAETILVRGQKIALLMNNAGTMQTGLHITEDGFEQTVSVNYLAPYLLTRKLLPLMTRGSRVVSMVSCTYAVGRLDFPDFFERGKKGAFWRIPIYSNTKLALLLFTYELADRLREQGIAVNAADPGIVSTPIITMHMWFDPLTDVLFRPFIRTPLQGASTAIGLLLRPDVEGQTGTFNLSNHSKTLGKKYTDHEQKHQLWEETEKRLAKWL